MLLAVVDKHECVMDIFPRSKVLFTFRKRNILSRLMTQPQFCWNTLKSSDSASCDWLPHVLDKLGIFRCSIGPVIARMLILLCSDEVRVLSSRYDFESLIVDLESVPPEETCAVRMRSND